MAANNLKILRGKHGLSQAELAKMVGVTKQRISQAENGALNPRLAKKIAECLGENVFNVLGLSSFTILPESFEDREILFDVLRK